MSHYIYKKKKFLELPDGRILPLCLYADSSVTSTNYDSHRRPHSFHPKSWCINTFSPKEGILIERDKFQEYVKEAYEQEMNCLIEYRNKYKPCEPEPNEESYGYYGTVYPAGRKMKHMKSFYSVRHTVFAEEFLNRNKFSIKISIYDTKTYNTLESKTIFIEKVDDIIYAEEVFEDMYNKKIGRMCIGIHGLADAD